MTKKFYTWNNIDDGCLTQKQKYKNRAILRIATENGAKSKASEERFLIAKKLYNSIKKLNNWRDYELEADSYEKTQKYAVLYERKQDSIYNKIKPLAKKLNLKIYCGTWWHLTTQKNNIIYFE